MIPGTVLFDRQFRFKDGTLGEKLFVVLNEGTNGKYIGVKTTSQHGRHSNTYGCGIAQRFPAFYLPISAVKFFKTDTWIQLGEFYSFDSSALIQKVMVNRITRIGVLEPELAMDIIQCASQSEDISLDDCKTILKECACLTKPPTKPSRERASTST